MTSLNGTIQGIGTGANRIVKKTGTEIKLSVYDNIDRVIVFNEAGETSQTGTPTPDNPVDIVGIGTRQLDGTYKVSIDYDDGDERTGTITASGLAYPLYEGDILDFVNRKVIRANGCTDCSNLNWRKYTATANVFVVLNTDFPDKAAGLYNFKSSFYPLITASNIANMPDKSIRGNATQSNIYIKDSSYATDWENNTPSNFKSAMSGNMIVYPLATPTDEYITLSGDISDIGTATVTADGTLTVKYDKVEMAIRKYSSPPEWSKIGYTATPSEVMSAFDYAKTIKDNWTYTSGTIPKYTNDKRLFFFPNVNVDESLGYNAMFEASNLLHIEPITIGQGTPGGVVNCQTMFKGALIEEIEISAKTSTQHFNTDNMFNGCLNLKEAEINLISENPQAMFIGCKSLERVTGSLDTSTATNFSTMFEDCSSLLISPPDLDLTAATNLYRIFHNCTSLETIEAWIFSNVTNFQQAFWNCSSLKNLPLMALTAATNLSSMFQGTGSNLTEQSRDNLLRSLTSATSYTGTKTLAQLGFTSSMYTAASWQALTHYSDFTTAGWSIGYS